MENASSLGDGASPQPTTWTTLCDQLRSRSGELGEDGAEQAERIVAAALSYERRYREEFSVTHDDFRLIGQDNFRRYLPVPAVRVRVHPQDTAFDVFARVFAARVAGSRVTVSVSPMVGGPWNMVGGDPDMPPTTYHLRLLADLTKPWGTAIEFVEEGDDQFIQAIGERRTDRVRYAAPDRVPLAVLEAAGRNGVCVISRPVLAEGRLELLWYLQEQSISIDYHRYGNLGTRSGEARKEPT